MYNKTYILLNYKGRYWKQACLAFSGPPPLSLTGMHWWVSEQIYSGTVEHHAISGKKSHRIYLQWLVCHVFLCWGEVLYYYAIIKVPRSSK